MYHAKKMLKGVRQLRELVIRYSDIDGSSKGIREWVCDCLIILYSFIIAYQMRTDLIRFANENQYKDAHTESGLVIRTELKRCCHPFLMGKYLNGNSKTICIKNLSTDEIQEYVLFLRNQIGRKVHNLNFKFIMNISFIMK